MWQIVCDSVEQETLAFGEESFLNNLVKTFKLPALTLALGRGLAACSWLSDSCGSRILEGDELKSTQSRSKGILGLHRAREREAWSYLPLPAGSAGAQHPDGTVWKSGRHLSKCLSG